MVGIAEAKAAYDGIKAAIDMARGAAALNSETDIKLAIIDIVRQLLDAQQATLADREKMAELRLEMEDMRRQLADHGKWNAERLRYQLTQSSLGAFTYDLKPEETNGEPFHRLCTTCFENGKKSILHVSARHSGGEKVRCQSCNVDLLLSPFQSTVVISESRFRDEY